MTEDAKQKEHSWLKSTESVFKDTPEPTLGGAAYHTQNIKTPIEPVENDALLLWSSKSEISAKQKHRMSVTIAVTEKFNPGQIPALTYNNPLYAIC